MLDLHVLHAVLVTESSAGVLTCVSLSLASHSTISFDTELFTAGAACAACSTCACMLTGACHPGRYVAMGEASLLNPLVVANARGQGVVAGNVVGRGTNLTLAYTPITLTSHGAYALPHVPLRLLIDYRMGQALGHLL